ncbi:helix-turn-helix domain-containing protein [Dermabacteraceae bacterium CCM 9519]
MVNNAWAEWFATTTGEATDVEVAERMGANKSTVGRWRKSPPAMEKVVAIARAYSVSVTDALVSAGQIDECELHVPKVVHDLAQFTNSELADEVKRRLGALEQK